MKEGEFLFRAFRKDKDAPRMNQAETIHSSWTKRGEEDLTLLEAAQADALANVMLETEYSQLRERGKELEQVRHQHQER